MKYTFKGEVTPLDFFRLSMHRTYHSIVGVCNIVFTVAVILLTMRFWNHANDLIEVLLFLGCILFPVLQPFAVYMKAKAMALTVPRDMILDFDDAGLTVIVGEKKESIRWDKMVGIVKEHRMLILFSDTRHGYMLPDRVLGKEKETFYEDVKSRIGKK